MLLLLVWDTSCESILQSGEARELGGRAGGRLKPDVKVSNAGDRPPRLGRDVVTFEDMREFLVAYLELSLIHISEPTRLGISRMPSSA